MASSTEIAALAVSLSLDSNNFSRAMSAITNQIKNIDKDFKSAGQGVSNFENTIAGVGAKLDATRAKIDLYNQKLATQQRQYDSLNNVFTTQNARLRELEATLGRGSQEWQNQAQLVQRNAQQLTNLDTAMNHTRGAVANLNSVMSTAEGDLRRLQTEASNASNRFRTFQSSLEGVGNKLKSVGGGMKDFGSNLAIGAGAAAAAIALPLASAIKTGLEFEDTMTKTFAKVDNITKQQEGQFKQMAQDLAPLTGGANKAAQGFDELAAKGYSADKILKMMPAIATAANASGEDLKLTSETITGAMETWNMDATKAAHVGDVLAQAANKTAAGMEDMKYTFNYAAQPAKNLGVSVEQLAAITGIMANQNIKGEAAGTALRMGLIRLSGANATTNKTMKELGIATKDAHGNFRPLSSILGEIKDKTDKMGNAQKSVTLAHIFGANAVSAMSVAVSAGKDKIDGLTKSLEKSDGASKKQSDTMKASFPGAVKQMQGSLDAAKISIEEGLAPALQKIATFITKVTTAFNKLDPHTRNFIVIGAAISAVVLVLVAVIGGFIAVIGSAIAGVGQIILIGSKLMPVIEGIGAVFTAIDWPILLIVAGLALVGVAIYECIKHWDSIKKYLSSLGGWLKGVWNGMMGNISSFLNSVGNWFSSKWKSISSTTQSVWNGITSFFKRWGPLMLSALAGPLGILVYEIATHWNQIKSGASKAWNSIKSSVVSVVGGLKSGIVSIISGIKSTISSIWSGITNILTHPFESAKRTIASIIGGIKNTVGGIKSALGKLLTVEAPTFVAPPTGPAMSAMASAQGPVASIAASGSIVDSMSDLGSSIGGSDFSSGLYSSNAGVLQATASTKADTAAMIKGLESQNKNLETQNTLLMQMVNLLSAGQQIAVNVDGRQVALATSSYMDNALRKNRDSKSRARGGK